MPCAPGYDDERSFPIQTNRALSAGYGQEEAEAARQKTNDLVAMGMDLPIVPIPVEPERGDEEFPGKVSEAVSEIVQEGFRHRDGGGGSLIVKNHEG